MDPKAPLVYVLHSGNLYGTERMALYTVAGLSTRFEPIILAPNGPAIREARAQGLQALPFQNVLELSTHIRRLLSRSRRLAFVSTGVLHSLLCIAWNFVYNRRVAHLHLVHGGASERLSYGRKKLLNRFPVQFVAVSQYVRERLVAHGVDAQRIKVIENFLPEGQIDLPGRPPFHGESPRRVAVISRLDPEKRVSLLLDALEKTRDLRNLQFHVFGSGREAQLLKNRAAQNGLPVVFEGFHSNIRAVLPQYDLLVHLCPVEPFGLAIIEAMAAGVPALVPDSGGAGSLVDDARTGFHFKANDADHLAQRLLQLESMDSEQLNQVAARAHELHRERFSAAARISEYEHLLSQGLA